MRLVHRKQKGAWLANGIPDYATRIDRMDRLIALLADRKDEIVATIREDYGKRSIEESLLAEVLYLVNSLKFNKVHLRECMEPELHETPFPDGIARVEFQPKGVIGVISPWNLPWLLALLPVINIFAAGNVCMLKPSELTPKTSALMARLVTEFFDETELTVLQGGPETGAAFAALPFDHLIYTGGTKIGQGIIEAAAKNLAPVTLELGGKSPVLCGRTADIGDVARRVMTAKTFNAGQTCLAPDYVFLPRGTEDSFVAFATKAVHDMYGALKENSDFSSIINARHFDRLRSWTEDAKHKGARVVELNPAGEDFAESHLHRLPPSLILDVNEEMTVMQEEIFGPLLPIKTYENIAEAITYVRNHPSPWPFITSAMIWPKNALFSTEQHPAVSPSMTVWLMHFSKAFHSVELVLQVWAVIRARRAFLLFLTLAPSTGRADRRKLSILFGLLLERKPVHLYWRR